MKALLGLGRLLLREAVAAIAPVIGGCAGALIGRAAGHSAFGRAVGGGLERAIDYFGKRIAERWLEVAEDHSDEQTQLALEELASLPPAEVRRETEALLADLHLSFADADKQVALDYLTAIPPILARTLARGRTGKTTAVAAFADPLALLDLLPTDVPPYAAPCPLPGTPYRLEALVGAGGFGTVYRATDPKMPYMPLAIKFCRDASAAPIFHRERDNLERLVRADLAGWSPRVVRFWGYDLDHATPFLVYEWVPGGDLATAIETRTDRPSAQEALAWVQGIVEGLAFAHRHGVVHRDLKPANILLAADGVKLADFGIGGIAVLENPATASRSLLRGAGTPLYMAPEQRRGAAPDPRHDVYSVGVIWFQLLLGDCGADLHPGWEEELREEAHAPESHIELIRRCVAPAAKRPADAGELLALLRDPETATLEDAAPSQLVQQMRQLREAHEAVEKASQPTFRIRAYALLIAFVIAFVVMFVFEAVVALTLEAMGLMRGRNQWLMPVFAIGGLVASTFLGVLVYRQRVRRSIRMNTDLHRRNLERQADVIANLFAEAVAAWGGRDILMQAEPVDRLSRQLEVQADMTARDRQRLARWKPSAHAATAAPAKTAGPVADPATISPVQETAANPGADLLRELVRQYQEGLNAVANAAPTPGKVRAQTGAIAFYSFGAIAGLTIALPVTLIAIQGDFLGRAVGIPVVSVIGAAISGTLSYLLCRLFLNWQRRLRLQGPLRELNQRVDLLLRAFPKEIEEWGGRAALLDPDMGTKIRTRLELLVS